MLRSRNTAQGRAAFKDTPAARRAATTTRRAGSGCLCAAITRPPAGRSTSSPRWRHGISCQRNEVANVLADAKRQESILKAISRPAEAKPWNKYRPIFLTRERINGGVDFWNTTHRYSPRAATLRGDSRDHRRHRRRRDPLRRQYGQLYACWMRLHAGLRLSEARRIFSQRIGTVPAADPRRTLDVRTAKVRMPAPWARPVHPEQLSQLCVDFDGDGRRDLWHSSATCSAAWPIISRCMAGSGRAGGQPCAGHRHGLQGVLEKGLKPHMSAGELSKFGVSTDSPIAADTPASRWSNSTVLMDWSSGSGFNNFYVITRYNRSPLYAMAVYQLSNEIAAARTSAQR